MSSFEPSDSRITRAKEISESAGSRTLEICRSAGAAAKRQAHESTKGHGWIVLSWVIAFAFGMTVASTEVVILIIDWEALHQDLHGLGKVIAAVSMLGGGIAGWRYWRGYDG